MGNCYLIDHITAEDYIHTDITCNIEEPQQRYRLGMMIPKAIEHCYKSHKANLSFKF